MPNKGISGGDGEFNLNTKCFHPLNNYQLLNEACELQVGRVGWPISYSVSKPTTANSNPISVGVLHQNNSIKPVRP
jgi:hypothetical protein